MFTNDCPYAKDKLLSSGDVLLSPAAASVEKDLKAFCQAVGAAVKPVLKAPKLTRLDLAVGRAAVFAAYRPNLMMMVHYWLPASNVVIAGYPCTRVWRGDTADTIDPIVPSSCVLIACCVLVYYNTYSIACQWR